jgi:hypothetical protein
MMRPKTRSRRRTMSGELGLESKFDAEVRKEFLQDGLIFLEGLIDVGCTALT